MKRQINVRLSDTAIDLLVRLAKESYGDISQAAVLEVMLRAEAKRQGLIPKGQRSR